MEARTEAVALLVGGGIADFAFRIAQVALPLVILQETGSVALTGLVGGAAGIPMVLSPWWARKARQWVDSGRRLAVVAAISALAIAMVPAAAATGQLGPVVLIGAGLLLGCGDALSNPGRSALLADTGDRWAPDRAAVLLTWQDGLKRLGMLAGPPIGAVAVAAGVTEQLLWIEAAAVLAAGLLVWTIRAERRPGAVDAPSIRACLRGRPAVRDGWIARGTGCLAWFAFTLGLSVIGAQRDQPGLYLAAGVSGYGVGALLGALVALRVVRRVPPVVAAGLAWILMGGCWVGMGVWTTPVAVAGFGAFAGLTVAIGITAISALITRTSNGPERRALLSGQSVVVNASASAGLLIGGPVIAAAGARATLVGAGTLTALVALVLLLRTLAVRGVAVRASASPG